MGEFVPRGPALQKMLKKFFRAKENYLVQKFGSTLGKEKH